MSILQISHYTLTTSLGRGVDSNWQKIQSGTTGLKPCDFLESHTLKTWIGEVEGLDIPLTKNTEFDCRNNRLSALGLQQDNFEEIVLKAKEKYGSSRIGVFIGTSTSGIQQTELAYKEHHSLSSENLPDWYNYDKTHHIYSVAEFVKKQFGLNGMTLAISTACSSSAKVFASAQRAIDAGLCDAAIVGGVDSLCYTTLYGFHSLQVTAENICRPSNLDREGISIGEGAGFALVEKHTEANDADVLLLAYGESADAYHMSTPHPNGDGAYLAMQSALNQAKLKVEDIDYINLHGTGTRTNDAAEGIAVGRLFGSDLPCSSTKGWTGHTLGAAGIIEAIISTLCIKHDWSPQSLNTETVDPEININIALQASSHKVKNVLSNSFGFGGSNCSLILGAAQ